MLHLCLFFCQTGARCLCGDMLVLHLCLFFCQTVFVWGYVSVTLVLVLLSDRGQVFVWGYGILGKGPELGHSDVPTMIPEPLFGRNEVQPDTTVVDIECGLGHFVALTGKLKRG